MTQQTMYPALANSPGTELSAGISNTDTSITVVNGAVLPDAPNTVTIGTDETAETVLYTGKSGNNLTGVTRGFGGTAARAWAVGTQVARYFTAYDHEAFRGNIEEHTVQLSETPRQTTADLTYYVRTDGNDSNNGLSNTSVGAFKTIGKAISMVPQVVNHKVTINVSAGTYAEDVVLSGYTGAGYVEIAGTSANVTSVTITRCNRVVISGVTGTSTSGAAACFRAYDGGYVDFLYCNTTSAGTAGFEIIHQRAGIKFCTVSNKTGAAIIADEAEVYLEGNSGTGNSNGINAGKRAVITTSGTQPGATTPVVSSGGVINAWGDYNSLSRTFIDASSTSVQSITANTATKVLFANETYDSLGEFSSSRFTASKSGQYMISAAVLLNSFSADSTIDISIKVNAGLVKTVRHVYRAYAQSATVSLPVKLVSGDTVEIYINPSSNGDIASGDGTRSWISIQREA